jgi:hypothetical protein
LKCRQYLHNADISNLLKSTFCTIFFNSWIINKLIDFKHITVEKSTSVREKTVKLIYTVHALGIEMDPLDCESTEKDLLMLLWDDPNDLCILFLDLLDFWVSSDAEEEIKHSTNKISNSENRKLSNYKWIPSRNQSKNDKYYYCISKEL